MFYFRRQFETPKTIEGKQVFTEKEPFEVSPQIKLSCVMSIWGDALLVFFKVEYLVD